MRHRPRRNPREPEPLWWRVDRAVREVNPTLLMFALGLAVLYLTCVFGLRLELPATGVSASASVPPSAADTIGPAAPPLPGAPLSGH